MNQIVFIGQHQKTFVVPDHKHLSWEIVYCTSGKGKLYFKDMILPYSEGNIIIIPPHASHANYSDTGFTNIHINMLDPELSIAEPCCVTEKDDLLYHAFSDALTCFHSNASRKSSAVDLYGQLIVCHLNNILDIPSYNDIVGTIIHAINDNLSNSEFHLDTYLRSQPYSYDYIRKVFKKQVTCTPHQYLTDCRLKTAVSYIKTRSSNHLNISEIAQMCGFSNPLYFSRLFKKKYGTSPSDFNATLKSYIENVSSNDMKHTP